MKKVKIVSIFVTAVLLLSALVGCVPTTDNTTKHVCGHVCPVCGKCLDATCTDEVCAEKCGGHEGGQEVTYQKGIIDLQYDSEEAVIADHIIDSSVGADPTGVKDSTSAIQSVLNACADKGGGTVFLPAGRYRVTSQIRIPSFVYLRGDWNDPDGERFDGKYGTVIAADVAEAAREERNPILADREDIYANFPALFRIGGSSGLIGVTIYYPKQDVADVTPYPFAVEIPSFAGEGGHINHHAPTVKNVTFVNCYKGIIAGASASSEFSGGYGAAFEQAHIENIRGTFLYQGFQLYIASEAGVVKNVSIANKYWKESSLTTVDESALDRYTMKYTTGMLLGDLEWLFFNDISIRDVCMGVRIYDGIRRFFTNEIYFIGQFYHLDVRNTKTAMRIDNMFFNFGITIADSYLEGSVYSINERDTTTASVKMVRTQLVGDTYGDSLMLSGIDDKYEALQQAGALALSARPIVHRPKEVLYDVVEDYGADNTGKTNSAAAIQKALTDANANGGGIVYLPAGYYWLDSALTVYANTELRGCAGAATRDQSGMSKGSVLFGNCGYYNDKALAQNGTALVTLQGEGAGMRGLRIIYPNNKPAYNTGTYKYHTYAVRIVGENSYVAQSSIVGVPYAIEVSRTKNVTITEVSGTFYDIGINIVGSENVYVDEVLQNAAVVARLGYGNVAAVQSQFLYGWPTDTSGLSQMYANITRPNLVLIKATDSSGVSIVNTSVFGIRTFYNGVNSSAKILACNSDNCSSYIWDVNGGQLTVVNMMKYNDTATYRIAGGAKITAFNPLTLHFTTNFTLDPDVYQSTEYPSVKIKTGSKYVNDLPERYVK